MSTARSRASAGTISMSCVSKASPTEVAERVKKAKGEGYRVVTLLVFREGDFRWVAVRIDKS